MKVAHILEYEFPNIRFQHKKRIPDQYNYAGSSAYSGSEGNWHDDDGNMKVPSVLKNKKTKHFGSGVFASTYGHEDRPHDVRKISRPQKVKEVDGYYHLLHALSNNKEMGTNPYFPRFRDIKIYRTPVKQSQPNSNKFVYSVNMERLFPLSDLRHEEIEAGLTKIFGIKNFEKMKNEHLEDLGDDSLTSNEVAWIFEILMFDEGLRNDIEDQDLKNAIEFIRQVSKQKRLTPDIHDENIMYRRGPGGIQFVITDPFSA